MLKQLARTEPYYKRNRPHVCSFYAKGECNRGDDCPYRCALVHPRTLFTCELTVENFRHEVPVNNELSKQNIQDRFFGRNDPVARKIMVGHAEKQGLQPPEDESVVSFLLARGWLGFPTLNAPHLEPDVVVPFLFACNRDGRYHPHTRYPIITGR
jgi:pre-mRNA-splicing factor RBM22/SLT11